MKSILSAGGSAPCYKQRLHSLPTEVLFQSDRGFVSPEQSFCSNRTKPPSHSKEVAVHSPTEIPFYSKKLRLKSNKVFASFERDYHHSPTEIPFYSKKLRLKSNKVFASFERDCHHSPTEIPFTPTIVLPVPSPPLSRPAPHPEQQANKRFSPNNPPKCLEQRRSLFIFAATGIYSYTSF